MTDPRTEAMPPHPHPPQKVGLLPCERYVRPVLKDAIDTLCRSMPFRLCPGDRVMLKPNLVAAQRHEDLACTHPEFVAAAAEYFLDHGAVVGIGDSPAFGTAKRTMAVCGISRALAGLPVHQTDFKRTRKLRLPGGSLVTLAAEPLECDLLVNLPKVKSHVQMLVTLAVKNFFGLVAGWRKPWMHMHYGGQEQRFAAAIVDLLTVLPDTITLMDGITAMHGPGPINGPPFPLKLLAGAINPVALDSSLLEILKIDPSQSPLWRECRRRELPGCHLENISYPLENPAAWQTTGFILPSALQPIRFQPLHLCKGSLKRAAKMIFPDPT